MKDPLRGYPAELLGVLKSMEDAQTRLEVIRLSATVYMSSFLHNIPWNTTKALMEKFNTRSSGVMRSSSLARGRAGQDNLPAIKSASTCPPIDNSISRAFIIGECGYGLTSCADICNATFIGCQALVLARAVATTARPEVSNLLDFLEHKVNFPSITDLMKYLKAESQITPPYEIDGTVGTSWTDLVLRQGPRNIEQGVLLTEAGSGGPMPRDDRDNTMSSPPALSCSHAMVAGGRLTAKGCKMAQRVRGSNAVDRDATANEASPHLWTLVRVMKGREKGGNL